MRFLCKTRDILQTIGIVSRAISSQQAMPILGNILFHSEGKRCTLSATNLEFSIISSFEAEVENEGSLTVPAKAIQNFAQYSTDEEILFESSEEAQLKCLSKKSKTIIAGESASEYPTISPIERENVFQIDSDQFLQAIAHVTFASARTTIRPVLSGVYFKGVKDELSLVATDSYRLSEYKIPLLEKQGEIDCIVPTKVLIEVMAVLSGGRKGKEDAGDETKKEDKISSQGPVRISLSAQQIEIVAGKTTVLSRLIDGSFPDYKQILPSSSKTTIHFPLAEILTNIRRMHYFAKESNNNLTIAVSGEEVLIQTQRTQIGRDESHIPTTIIGEKNKIALSSSYLLDFLTHISGEEVHMEIVDKMHPALFRVPGLPNFLHLIMPLRMTEE